MPTRQYLYHSNISHQLDARGNQRRTDSTEEGAYLLLHWTEVEMVRRELPKVASEHWDGAGGRRHSRNTNVTR